VKFPGEGSWVYLFDSSVIGAAGESLVLEIPLEDSPVFVREGAAVEEALRQVLVD
jgi:alpha-glucosidase (family GH31 glycosyl hydrolase)